MVEQMFGVNVEPDETTFPFEVYIHVPFCLKRCGYCDFNTYTATNLGEGASRENYANMAIEEMRLLKQWQHSHNIVEPPVSAIFFGGGTPTVLPAHDLVRMVEAIREMWGIETGAEITTEANPDTVDRSYLQELKDGSFTRVSFGMQSAVPHVLATLDRTHTPANVAANVAAAQHIGLECSVDLIYGTPGESIDDWRQSVETALNFGVNHISAYALTIESRTKMGRQIASGALHSPDDDDEANKYELADDIFASAGLQWYEISNWAQPGHESRHNLGYWRNVDWAGIGPGAHSHYNKASFLAESDATAGARQSTMWRSTGASQADSILQVQQHALLADTELMQSAPVAKKSLRAWDITHPGEWAHAINAKRIPWGGSEIIGVEENVEEIVMLGLRLREGLSLAKLERVAGKAISQQDVSALTQSGLAAVEAGRIVATRRGRLLNDDLISNVFEMVSR
ncbi:radical SAM family heme chaperone HemW [Bombiscardovia apis]|nr:radical SAM family heme chaperone HemW [Bombiscardovia apis]